MKAFFEEYGLAILVMIVVVVLLVIATPIGEAVKGALTTVVDDFSTSTQNYNQKAMDSLDTLIEATS